MGYLLLTNISLSNIRLKKDINENYRINYWDKNISVSGLHFYCKGFVKIVNDRFHFIIRDEKSLNELKKIENHFRGQFNDYTGFLKKKEQDHFILFNQNEFTNKKLNEKITGLQLNFKFIKKHYYTTIIHII